MKRKPDSPILYVLPSEEIYNNIKSYVLKLCYQEYPERDNDSGIIIWIYDFFIEQVSCMVVSFPTVNVFLDIWLR